MSADLVVQLDVNFAPEDLIPWYHDDSENPVLVLMVRNCPVQIRRCCGAHIHWWPEGGHGWTEPLEKTVNRLQMLQETRRMAAQDA
jgi:hypothetical protein